MQVLLVPPMHEQWITLLGAVHFPIELRREVVDPTFVPPFFSVGIQRGVRIKALDLRWISRTPDPERANTEFHPRFRLVYFGGHTLNEPIDILPAPIVTR